MATGPTTRARHLRSLLEHLDQLPAPQRAAVLEALGPGPRALIEASAGSDWLPFALDLDFTRAIGRVLGPEGQHRFFQTHQHAAFQGSLFRAMVSSATAIFGLDPGSWARWIPRGWGVVFRDCGRWVLDRTAPGEVDLALVAPPPACLDDELWLRSLASSFSAFLLVARCEGSFSLTRIDRAREAACYALRWRPP